MCSHTTCTPLLSRFFPSSQPAANVMNELICFLVIIIESTHQSSQQSGRKKSSNLLFKLSSCLTFNPASYSTAIKYSVYIRKQMKSYVIHVMLMFHVKRARFFVLLPFQLSSTRQKKRKTHNTTPHELC